MSPRPLAVPLLLLVSLGAAFPAVAGPAEPWWQSSFKAKEGATLAKVQASRDYIVVGEAVKDGTEQVIKCRTRRSLTSCVRESGTLSTVLGPQATQHILDELP